MTESQRPPIFLEGLACLATPLEDRAQECVDDGQIGRAHLELLELIGRLVEHLQLEVDAPERRGQGKIVRSALGSAAVQRDHAARPALLPVRPLEPREQWERGLRLHRALPRTHRLTGVADGLVGIAERHHGRREPGVRAKRGLEVADRAGRLAPRELEPAELVLLDGEPGGLGGAIGGRGERHELLLHGDRLVPVSRLDGEVAQLVQRAAVRGPALGDVTEERAGLVETTGPPRLLPALHRLRGLRIVLAVGRRTLEAQSTKGAVTERGERRER